MYYQWTGPPSVDYCDELWDQAVKPEPQVAYVNSQQVQYYHGPRYLPPFHCSDSQQGHNDQFLHTQPVYPGGSGWPKQNPQTERINTEVKCESWYQKPDYDKVCNEFLDRITKRKDSTDDKGHSEHYYKSQRRRSEKSKWYSRDRHQDSYSKSSSDRYRDIDERRKHRHRSSSSSDRYEDIDERRKHPHRSSSSSDRYEDIDERRKHPHRSSSRERREKSDSSRSSVSRRNSRTRDHRKSSPSHRTSRPHTPRPLSENKVSQGNENKKNSDIQDNIKKIGKTHEIGPKTTRWDIFTQSDENSQSKETESAKAKHTETSNAGKKTSPHCEAKPQKVVHLNNFGKPKGKAVKKKKRKKDLASLDKSQLTETQVTEQKGPPVGKSQPTDMPVTEQKGSAEAGQVEGKKGNKRKKKKRKNKICSENNVIKVPQPQSSEGQKHGKTLNFQNGNKKVLDDSINEIRSAGSKMTGTFKKSQGKIENACHGKPRNNHSTLNKKINKRKANPKWNQKQRQHWSNTFSFQSDNKIINHRTGRSISLDEVEEQENRKCRLNNEGKLQISVQGMAKQKGQDQLLTDDNMDLDSALEETKKSGSDQLFTDDAMDLDTSLEEGEITEGIGSNSKNCSRGSSFKVTENGTVTKESSCFKLQGWNSKKDKGCVFERADKAKAKNGKEKNATERTFLKPNINSVDVDACCSLDQEKGVDKISQVTDNVTRKEIIDNTLRQDRETGTKDTVKGCKENLDTGPELYDPLFPTDSFSSDNTGTSPDVTRENLLTAEPESELYDPLFPTETFETDGTDIATEEKSKQLRKKPEAGAVVSEVEKREQAPQETRTEVLSLNSNKEGVTVQKATGNTQNNMGKSQVQANQNSCEIVQIFVRETGHAQNSSCSETEENNVTQVAFHNRQAPAMVKPHNNSLFPTENSDSDNKNNDEKETCQIVHSKPCVQNEKNEKVAYDMNNDPESQEKNNEENSEQEDSMFNSYFVIDNVEISGMETPEEEDCEADQMVDDIRSLGLDSSLEKCERNEVEPGDELSEIQTKDGILCDNTEDVCVRDKENITNMALQDKEVSPENPKVKEKMSEKDVEIGSLEITKNEQPKVKENVDQDESSDNNEKEKSSIKTFFWYTPKRISDNAEQTGISSQDTESTIQQSEDIASPQKEEMDNVVEESLEMDLIHSPEKSDEEDDDNIQECIGTVYLKTFEENCEVSEDSVDRIDDTLSPCIGTVIVKAEKDSDEGAEDHEQSDDSCDSVSVQSDATHLPCIGTVIVKTEENSKGMDQDHEEKCDDSKEDGSSPGHIQVEDKDIQVEDKDLNEPSKGQNTNGDKVQEKSIQSIAKLTKNQDLPLDKDMERSTVRKDSEDELMPPSAEVNPELDERRIVTECASVEDNSVQSLNEKFPTMKGDFDENESQTEDDDSEGKVVPDLHKTTERCATMESRPSCSTPVHEQPDYEPISPNYDPISPVYDYVSPAYDSVSPAYESITPPGSPAKEDYTNKTLNECAAELDQNFHSNKAEHDETDEENLNEAILTENVTECLGHNGVQGDHGSQQDEENITDCESPICSTREGEVASVSTQEESDNAFENEANDTVVEADVRSNRENKNNDRDKNRGQDFTDVTPCQVSERSSQEIIDTPFVEEDQTSKDIVNEEQESSEQQVCLGQDRSVNTILEEDLEDEENLESSATKDHEDFTTTASQDEDEELANLMNLDILLDDDDDQLEKADEQIDASPKEGPSQLSHCSEISQKISVSDNEANEQLVIGENVNTVDPAIEVEYATEDVATSYITQKTCLDSQEGSRQTQDVDVELENSSEVIDVWSQSQIEENNSQVLAVVGEADIECEPGNAGVEKQREEELDTNSAIRSDQSNTSDNEVNEVCNDSSTPSHRTDSNVTQGSEVDESTLTPLQALLDHTPEKVNSCEKRITSTLSGQRLNFQDFITQVLLDNYRPKKKTAAVSNHETTNEKVMSDESPARKSPPAPSSLSQDDQHLGQAVSVCTDDSAKTQLETSEYSSQQTEQEKDARGTQEAIVCDLTLDSQDPPCIEDDLDADILKDYLNMYQDSSTLSQPTPISVSRHEHLGVSNTSYTTLASVTSQPEPSCSQRHQYLGAGPNNTNGQDSALLNITLGRLSSLQNDTLTHSGIQNNTGRINVTSRPRTWSDQQPAQRDNTQPSGQMQRMWSQNMSSRGSIQQGPASNESQNQRMWSQNMASRGSIQQGPASSESQNQRMRSQNMASRGSIQQGPASSESQNQRMRPQQNWSLGTNYQQGPGSSNRLETQGVWSPQNQPSVTLGYGNGRQVQNSTNMQLHSGSGVTIPQRSNSHPGMMGQSQPYQQPPVYQQQTPYIQNQHSGMVSILQPRNSHPGMMGQSRPYQQQTASNQNQPSGSRVTIPQPSNSHPGMMGPSQPYQQPPAYQQQTPSNQHQHSLAQYTASQSMPNINTYHYQNIQQTPAPGAPNITQQLQSALNQHEWGNSTQQGVTSTSTRARGRGRGRGRGRRSTVEGTSRLSNETMLRARGNETGDQNAIFTSPQVPVIEIVPMPLEEDDIEPPVLEPQTQVQTDSCNEPRMNPPVLSPSLNRSFSQGNEGDSPPILSPIIPKSEPGKKIRPKENTIVIDCEALPEVPLNAAVLSVEVPLNLEMASHQQESVAMTDKENADNTTANTARIERNDRTLPSINIVSPQDVSEERDGVERNNNTPKKNADASKPESMKGRKRSHENLTVFESPKKSPLRDPVIDYDPELPTISPYKRARIVEWERNTHQDCSEDSGVDSVSDDFALFPPSAPVPKPTKQHSSPTYSPRRPSVLESPIRTLSDLALRKETLSDLALRKEPLSDPAPRKEPLSDPAPRKDINLPSPGQKRAIDILSEMEPVVKKKKQDVQPTVCDILLDKNAIEMRTFYGGKVKKDNMREVLKSGFSKLKSKQIDLHKQKKVCPEKTLISKQKTKDAILHKMSSKSNPKCTEKVDSRKINSGIRLKRTENLNNRPKSSHKPTDSKLKTPSVNQNKKDNKDGGKSLSDKSKPNPPSKHKRIDSNHHKENNKLDSGKKLSVENKVVPVKGKSVDMNQCKEKEKNNSSKNLTHKSKSGLERHKSVDTNKHKEKEHLDHGKNLSDKTKSGLERHKSVDMKHKEKEHLDRGKNLSDKTKPGLERHKSVDTNRHKEKEHLDRGKNLSDKTKPGIERHKSVDTNRHKEKEHLDRGKNLSDKTKPGLERHKSVDTNKHKEKEHLDRGKNLSDKTKPGIERHKSVDTNRHKEKEHLDREKNLSDKTKSGLERHKSVDTNKHKEKEHLDHGKNLSDKNKPGFERHKSVDMKHKEKGKQDSGKNNIKQSTDKSVSRKDKIEPSRQNSKEHHKSERRHQQHTNRTQKNPDQLCSNCSQKRTEKPRSSSQKRTDRVQSTNSQKRTDRSDSNSSQIKTDRSLTKYKKCTDRKDEIKSNNKRGTDIDKEKKREKSSTEKKHEKRETEKVKCDRRRSTEKSVNEKKKHQYTSKIIDQRKKKEDILENYSTDEILEEFLSRDNIKGCICGRVFRDSALYYMHRGSHGDSPLCLECHKGHKEWHQLEIHLIDNHQDVRGKR